MIKFTKLIIMNLHFCEKVMKLNWLFYVNILAILIKLKLIQISDFRQTDKQTNSLSKWPKNPIRRQTDIFSKISDKVKKLAEPKNW